jgi:hypothetical protein
MYKVIAGVNERCFQPPVPHGKTIKLQRKKYVFLCQVFKIPCKAMWTLAWSVTGFFHCLPDILLPIITSDSFRKELSLTLSLAALGKVNPTFSSHPS